MIYLVYATFYHEGDYVEHPACRYFTDKDKADAYCDYLHKTLTCGTSFFVAEIKADE